MRGRCSSGGEGKCGRFLLSARSVALILAWVVSGLAGDVVAQVFATNSAAITNPYFPVSVGDTWKYTGTVYYANMDLRGTRHAVAVEKLGTTNCIRLEESLYWTSQGAPFAATSSIWYAQDTTGSV